MRVIMPSDVFTGIVLYTPCATGDCWHIRDASEHISEETRPLRYVQTFTEIVLLEKGNSVP